MQHQNDSRRVALIKSLTTKNRFYALVEPERGIRNADTVEEIPGDLLLGIAYPCLEDGLNDFAVIRTTFETLDLFPEEDPIREEMMEIVNDARSNLLRRLNELRDKIHADKAHFLGTDYDEFKGYALKMATKGYPRRKLDSMMKVNDLFLSVAEAEGYTDSADLTYRYEFGKGIRLEQLTALHPRAFIVALFNDVLNSVLDDGNYRNKYLFDRNVFQKFIAVMFVNYATTDPIFYGINKSDYGVSGDKEMDQTPLYVAVRRELTGIERRQRSGDPHAPAPAPIETQAEPGLILPEMSTVADLPQSAHLPDERIHEETLLGPISSLCSAASLLLRKSDPETQRFARIIMADASKLVEELKRLGILPPLTDNPGHCG